MTTASWDAATPITAVAAGHTGIGRGPADPLICLATQPNAALRLVCFPHSGAGPAVFFRWAEALAPDIEVWSAVLPGRAGRVQESFARQWQPLIAEFADAVTSLSRYALFGQSLGALIAFEVTRELERRGRPAAHLVISASAAPDRREAFVMPGDDEALLSKVGHHFGGIPPRVRAEPELLAYFLPPLRADLELAAAYQYRPGSPVSAPITAFAGDQDPSVPTDGLAGWRDHTTGGCDVHRLRGGHFCLDRHQDRALAVIRQRLAS
jgi:surfactin synthase thioesterase subunit